MYGRTWPVANWAKCEFGQIARRCDEAAAELAERVPCEVVSRVGEWFCCIGR
jgi:hypothetical protein